MSKNPEKITIKGGFITLEPLDIIKHGNDLWAEVGKDDNVWKYLFSGPFEKKEDFLTWFKKLETNVDRTYFTCINKNGKALGCLSFTNILPEKSQIEIGGIFFGKAIQRTSMSTESIFLLMQNAFEDLGFKRVEWRCNSLNEPSKSAAYRFGFKFEEEILNQATPKGTRNTLVFGLSKCEWQEEIKPAFSQWLSPRNFMQDGTQKLSLGEIRKLNELTLVKSTGSDKILNIHNLHFPEERVRVDLSTEEKSDLMKTNQATDIKPNPLRETNQSSVDGKTCNSLL